MIPKHFGEPTSSFPFQKNVSVLSNLRRGSNSPPFTHPTPLHRPNFRHSLRHFLDKLAPLSFVALSNFEITLCPPADPKPEADEDLNRLGHHVRPLVYVCFVVLTIKYVVQFNPRDL